MTSSFGRQAATVREIPLDDELTLFDSATGTALALNQTARAVWSHADGSTTLDEVVAALATEYGTTPDAIRDDVRMTVASLVEAGVLLAQR